MNDSRLLGYGWVILNILLLCAFFWPSNGEAAVIYKYPAGLQDPTNLVGPSGLVTPTATSTLQYADFYLKTFNYVGTTGWQVVLNSNLSPIGCTTVGNPKTLSDWGGDNSAYGALIRVQFTGTCTLNTNVEYQILRDAYGNGGNYGLGAISGSTWLTLYDSTPPPLGDTTTRIIDFSPENGTTTQNPVFFEVNAYVNSNDLGIIKGVDLRLHNIDQNVLLLGFLSPSDIVLVDQTLEAGYFNFSTSTFIGEGNYRLEACITQTYVNSWFQNPFSDINDCQSHSFVVGTSTFIGNISQNLWNDTNDFWNGSSATTSAAMAATCNPFSSNFGIRECTSFLLIPDSNQMRITMTEAKNAIFKRFPWGYFTRTIDILANPATTSLPSITASLQMGAGEDLTPEITTVTFDINDMVAGGATLVESIEDPIHGQSFRDVFYNWIAGLIALLVLLTIIADIARTHQNDKDGESRAKNSTS